MVQSGHDVDARAAVEGGCCRTSWVAASSLGHVQRDPVPDPRSLGPEKLKRLLKGLMSREQEVSSTRQVLHAQIDSLRRELVDRLRDEGSEVIFGPDVPGSGLSARCELGVFSE
jgi:hypothetical protein